jgi:hypothetical protein
MNIALWIAQTVLALIFVAAAIPKLVLSRGRLAEKMTWTRDASDLAVKLLGAAELLGAVGLILPGLVGIAPILTPIAAACLFVVLVGALVMKLRLHESPGLPAVAALVAAFVIIGRFRQ